MTSNKKPRVIYIAGYGRSGSTILDIALAQHPAIFGAGEITTLTRHVWAQNEYCACGSAIRDCPVWGDGVRQWLEDPESLPFERYGILQRRFESFAGPVFKWLGGKAGQRDFDDYARQTLRLFDAIASASGSMTIIDSSKSPWRAFALARITGIDLHVVHLVRDGRAVAWSLLKRYDRDVKAGLQKNIRPKSEIRTAVRWGYVNLITELLGRRLGPGRFTRVRYEDFTADPDITLQTIGRWIDIEFDHIGAELKKGVAFQPGHQMAGNRLRMKQELVLIHDDAWQAQMPAGKKTTFGWLCGWLLRRYGYS